MRVVIDIEANALFDPTEIWVIVCKDIDTGVYSIFQEVTKDEAHRKAFRDFWQHCTLVIGHNWLGYDYPVLSSLLQLEEKPCVDTFILSKLLDYSRKGHSIEAFGIEFDFKKGETFIPDFFKKWSQELEDYCVRDVDICHRIYLKYQHRIHAPSLEMEQRFQLICNDLHTNGFGFNASRANSLLTKVKGELDELDIKIRQSFPPKLTPIKTIHPRLTRHGTLNKSDFRWVKDGDLTEFNGGPFCRCSWQQFNPSSHRQIVSVLRSAGWAPTDKTTTHIDTERKLALSKITLDKNVLRAKLDVLHQYGWKINEQNLSTLPASAPAPARTLAKRILLESRRRTLVEWLSLVKDDRIHGKFLGIGAWTHRMAHQEPNMANIPNALREDGSVKLLGKELRSLWIAPKNRLLAGVDAEGIQLRVFAHYVDDKVLTESIVNGSKSNKTDPHSINREILQAKSRQAAKRFLYALFLGGGIGRLSQILEATREDTEEALNRLLKQYPGFDYLRREVIPSDAKRGYFIGLDGRRVPIPGDTLGEKRHLAMSGYLQNGEAIIMKKATLKWYPKVQELKGKLVNLVHDEWQTECPSSNTQVALDICSVQSAALREVGEELGLKCPMAGSYYNEDVKDYTIGTNWAVTH